MGVVSSLDFGSEDLEVIRRRRHLPGHCITERQLLLLSSLNLPLKTLSYYRGNLNTSDVGPTDRFERFEVAVTFRLLAGKGDFRMVV
jgi:hypothetical protein